MTEQVCRRLVDRIAIVTGGASGIGEGIVRRFHAEGARVVLADVDMVGARLIADDLGDRVLAIECDASDAQALSAVVDQTVSRHGAIDVLCNNVGFGIYAQTQDTDPADWLKVFDLGIHAAFHGCRLALPHLIKSKGNIVNIASLSGLGGDFGMGAYNASKGAIVNWTRSLAVDHAADGVRANAICPGLIATGRTTFIAEDTPLGVAWINGIPLRRRGTPAEIGAAAAFLASDDASFMTGAIMVVDGGADAWTGQPNAGDYR